MKETEILNLIIFTRSLQIYRFKATNLQKVESEHFNSDVIIMYLCVYHNNILSSCWEY